MASSLSKKLRESGMATPESDAITQVVAREKKRPKAHRHRWYIPSWGDGTEQHCRQRNCMAHRPTEGTP